MTEEVSNSGGTGETMPQTVNPIPGLIFYV